MVVDSKFTCHIHVPSVYPGAPFPPGAPMPPYMVRPPMQAPYGAPRGHPGGPTAPPLHLPRGLPALRKKVDDDKDKPPEEQSMKVFVGKLPSDVPVGNRTYTDRM